MKKDKIKECLEILNHANTWLTNIPTQKMESAEKRVLVDNMKMASRLIKKVQKALEAK